MNSQLDDFCAWAQPCNGTYLNKQAFCAVEVWKAAQAAMQAELDQSCASSCPYAEYVTEAQFAARNAKDAT